MRLRHGSQGYELDGLPRAHMHSSMQITSEIREVQCGGTLAVQLGPPRYNTRQEGADRSQMPYVLPSELRTIAIGSGSIAKRIF